MPKIDVYGWQGVNTTKNPIQLDDNELSKAQNAFRDTAGEHGALRKRPGLTKINSVALSGEILGFINVPLNPITIRRFLIGADQTATAPAYTWFTSVNEFGAISTVTTPGATPKKALSEACFFGVIGTTMLNKATQSERLFIYPGDHTAGAVWPIRAWDGTVDRKLFDIPPYTLGVVTQPTLYNPTAASPPSDYVSQVCQLLLVGSKLYIVIADYVKPAVGRWGRVLEYNFETRGLRQIGQGAGTLTGDIGDGGVLFRSLAYFQGYLYAGVGSTTTGYNCTDAGIWKIQPDTESTWVRELTLESGTVGEIPTCFAEYRGQLYAGLQDYDSAAQRLLVRATDGTWSQSTSFGTAAGSGWLTMKVFGTNLYATSYDNAATDATSIHKFDGSSWTAVKTITEADCRMYVELVVHDDRIYALGAESTTGTGRVSHSDDGTTWVDITTGLTADVTSVFGVLAT